MPETPQPAPEKGRKNRSLGAFLLFLTVLVAILIAVGNDPFRAQKTLSEDQYQWYLYQGKIATQTFRGENLIEGTFTSEIDGRNVFKVSFADAKDREALFSQLKARKYQTITPEALREGIEGGWYKPREFLTVKAVQSPLRKPTGEEPRTERQSKTTELLYVNVLARSQAAWDRKLEEDTGRPVGPGDEPAFALPTASGTLNLRVDEPDDLVTLAGLLEEHGVTSRAVELDITEQGGTSWKDPGTLLSTLLLVWGPWILIFVVFLLFMRQMRSQGGAGGVMSFGRSRAQLYSKENHTNITFDDVAGAVEAKDEVREVVEFLKNPSRFTRIGGRIPRGVLLVGTPGCGKTLLAKAIAGEAEVPFFSISGSDFVEMFVGVGASRVRDLFKQARENSPCIIFLDEIDAVGRRRGSGMGGGHDEREQTLNAILVEMDGFGTDEGIIVIAATNRPDVLDPALLRPGRFDREVVIDLPDVEGRAEILEVHLKKVKVGGDCDVKTLAKSTPGYSGADLAAIINEAAIRAALNKRDEISMDDLEEARDKVRYGRQKHSRKLEAEDKKITAYHEAGHAIVSVQIPEVDPPHKVTIVPRGRALGATMILPDKESYHMQKKRMIGQLAMLFGGRVAEQEFCGDISAGASDDIQRATDLARAMVTELGMSEKIGPVNYSERQGSDFLGTELMRGRTHSEDTAREIDREVHDILLSAYERAEQIVRDHKHGVELIAQALLTYETVNGNEIEKLLAGTAVADLRPEPNEPEVSPERRESPTQPESPKKDEQAGDLPGEPGLSPA
jgi:cell division protease FtsH